MSFTDDEILQQMQWAPRQHSKATPLFLLHDGGGTIFSYMFLEDLDRDVWGISDPLFGTDKIWEGGLPQAAEDYVKRIKRVYPSGPLFLGGWSLGGMLSLQIAHVLSNDPKFQVKGIIMVDTPFPGAWTGGTHSRPVITTNSETVRKNVERRFQEAHRIARLWEVPTTWPGKSSTDAGKREFVHLPLDEEATTEVLESTAGEAIGAPPSALLIRCTQGVPNMTSAVDAARVSKLLGWEKYPGDFIRVVKDVDAHHYDVFQGAERIQTISEGIKKWCKEMDTRAR